MSELMWIRSHVERLLQEEWDRQDVEADADGDYGFRNGTAAGWIRVLDTSPPMVRVFAHAASGLKASAKLYAELNDIQGQLMSANIRLVGDVVLVSQTISPVGLTRPVLCQAIHAVGGPADDMGSLLASMFGGSTPYEAEVDATTNAPDDDRG